MVTRPGAFPAEYLPLLRYIPSWMPGGRFRKQAAVWKKTMSDLGDVPHEWVKSQMVCSQLFLNGRYTNAYFVWTEIGELHRVLYFEDVASRWRSSSKCRGRRVHQVLRRGIVCRWGGHCEHSFCYASLPCKTTQMFIIQLQTVAAMTAFFLLMAKFPSAQRHAQAELAQVVGDERLPNWTDQDNLPYVRALIQETLRWASVAPSGNVIICPRFLVFLSLK